MAHRTARWRTGQPTGSVRDKAGGDDRGAEPADIACATEQAGCLRRVPPGAAGPSRGRSVTWSARSAGRCIRTGSRAARNGSSYGQRRHPHAGVAASLAVLRGPPRPGRRSRRLGAPGMLACRPAVGSEVPGQAGRRDPAACLHRVGVTAGWCCVRAGSAVMRGRGCRIAEVGAPRAADAYAVSEDERGFDLEPTNRARGDSGFDQRPYRACCRTFAAAELVIGRAGPVAGCGSLMAARPACSGCCGRPEPGPAAGETGCGHAGLAGWHACCG